VVRACYEHFGAYFLEIISVVRFSRDEIPGLFDYEGWEHLEAAEAEGRGYFLMTGHFGTWEIAAYSLEVRLGKLNMVARPADNPYVERDLARIRQRLGTTLIDKRGSGHRMLNAFRRGERVAIVIDNKVRSSAGVRVPFLGRRGRETRRSRP
jgi:KDO2-lipid IV(A) lauroyltransferase